MNPYHPRWSLHSIPHGSTTLAVASLALTAVGTGVSAMGQMQQQQAQAQQAQVMAAQYRYQQQVQLQNQALAERQAADSLQRGRVAEQNRRQVTQQQIGQQTARLAAQGTDLEGSPTDILGDTAATGELDALTIRSNAEREAYGQRIAALGYGNEATMAATRAANSTYEPSYFGAGASLLSGASSLSEKWRKFQFPDAKGFDG